MVDGKAPSGGKPGGPGGMGGPGMGHRGPGGLEAAAKVLGMSVEDLGKELWSGKSLADVAKAKGVDKQKLIGAMVAEARTARPGGEGRSPHPGPGRRAGQGPDPAHHRHGRRQDAQDAEGGMPGGMGHHGMGPGGMGPGGAGPDGQAHQGDGGTDPLPPWATP